MMTLLSINGQARFIAVDYSDIMVIFCPGIEFAPLYCGECYKAMPFIEKT